MLKYKFKHVYVEIQNTCQFSCSFCPKTTRKAKKMNLVEIENIFSQVNKYTNEVYLHLLGEPLLHEDLDDIIKLAKKFNLLVNITTNGYLLKEKLNVLLENSNIRKINISLHSMEDVSNANKNIVSYLGNIFESVPRIVENNTTVVYRLWNSNMLYDFIIKKLEEKYNKKLNNSITSLGGTKLSNKTFLSIDSEFEWPVNSKNDSHAFCYALKTHLAINSSGDVLPCCLDSNGENVLGNIFENSLDEILSNKTTTSIVEGFRNNKAITNLCKKCSYKDRKKYIKHDSKHK